MKKERFSDKMIRRFYGITGPLDEQKRQTAERMGNIAFMWIFWILIFGNAIALTLGYLWPQAVAFGYPAILEIAILGLSAYIVRVSKKSGIDEIELESQTDKEKKSLRYAGLKAGLFFGVFFYLTFSSMIAISEKANILQNLLSPRYILGGLLGGLFFGLSMHLVIKGRIRRAQKREEEDE